MFGTNNFVNTKSSMQIKINGSNKDQKKPKNDDLYFNFKSVITRLYTRFLYSLYFILVKNNWI